MRVLHLLLAPALACAACGLADRGLQTNDTGASDAGGNGGDDGGGGGRDASADTNQMDAAGDAAPDLCPSAEGATMVHAGSSGFCIDTTEVTNAEYAAFLDAVAAGDAPTQPAWCAFNASFVPGNAWPYATGADKLPVVWVNWCDADTYCKWAQKRLCGRIGGGSNPMGSSGDPAESEWFSACSANGTRGYPYGWTYDDMACFSNQTAGTAPVAVGSYPKCVGGYAGIFDMSGNAWEWEDSCNASTGAGDMCLIRGGGTANMAGGLDCSSNVAVPRDNRTGDRGFRCCSQ
jgi:sulfatase modifying factor 1